MDDIGIDIPENAEDVIFEVYADRHRRQAFATVESVVTDAANAFGNGNAFQRDAIQKSLFSDLAHAVL